MLLTVRLWTGDFNSETECLPSMYNPCVWPSAPQKQINEWLNNKSPKQTLIWRGLYEFEKMGGTIKRKTCSLSYLFIFFINSRRSFMLFKHGTCFWLFVADLCIVLALSSCWRAHLPPYRRLYVETDDHAHWVNTHFLLGICKIQTLRWLHCFVFKKSFWTKLDKLMINHSVLFTLMYNTSVCLFFWHLIYKQKAIKRPVTIAH